MSDDERRRLERDARYEAGLMALLVCLREGHAPSRERGRFVIPEMVRPWRAGASEFAALEVAACGRCGLVVVVPPESNGVGRVGV